MTVQRAWGRGRRASLEVARSDESPGPGVVTAIREDPRRPGRYELAVGAATIGPITAEVIGSQGIRVGRVMDEAALHAVAVAARWLACYDRATGALARRARSGEELRRWLRDREFATADIDEVLRRLTTLGVLDDLAFARGFAHGRAVGRGFGLRRVAAELSRRGVASGIIATVLAELSEGVVGNEAAAIERAARRRMRSVGTLEPAVARRRLLGWLVRRGFPVGECLKVVRGLLPGR